MCCLLHIAPSSSSMTTGNIKDFCHGFHLLLANFATVKRISTLQTYIMITPHRFFSVGRWLTILLLWFIGQPLATAQSAATYPLKLRIASYNIHHGKGLDGKLDFQRIGTLLERLDADVVAIQEVDSVTTRAKGTYALEEIVRQVPYYTTYGPCIDLQGGKYGIGILSKERPINVKRIPLPGRGEARMLLVAEFDNYVFACTHLSLEEDERLASAAIIEREAASHTKPFLVAGDWNDDPNSALIRTLQKKFQICTNTSTYTFPADKPETCIDYIAVYKGDKQMHRIGDANGEFAAYRPYAGEAAVVEHAEVIDEQKASDHRPVFVSLILPTPSQKLMTTQPYLQVPTPTTMDVMFQTNSVCHCWIEYGTDSIHTKRTRALLDGQEICYDIANRIRLEGLTPGTRYYYRVCAVELVSKKGYENHFGDTLTTRFYSFKTPDEAMSDFRCVIFNDLHENKECFDYLRSLLNGTDYDFVIFNGDCLPEPRDRQHAIDMIHNLADYVNGAEKPIIFLRGNHEIRNFYSAGMHHLIGYYNEKTYGAFTWGATRFVMLDCGEDKPDSVSVYAGLNDFTRLRAEQIDFLRQEIKSKAFKKAQHRVLISHIPIYGNGDDYNPCLKLWSPMLDKAPFNAAIAAHNHKAIFYPNGTNGSTYPVIIGGGPSIKSGTVTIVSKQGKKLKIEVRGKDTKNHVNLEF